MATGFKIVNDVLTEMSFHLVEPVVNTTIVSIVSEGYGSGGYGSGGYGGSPDGPGAMIVTVGSTTAMYPGAMIIVGLGLPDEEVVTIISVSGNTFTAVLVNSHNPGETIVGATFPVEETFDPFFTQSEMLNYVADAQNDYLVRVPLIYNVVGQNFSPRQKLQAMPSDTIQIERIALNGFALYEQGQTSLDLINYNWPQFPAGNPRSWHEDRTGFMTYGLDNVPGNTFSVEVLYAQSAPGTLTLNGTFLLPDPFVTYIKYGALASVFTKDGEQNDPERARYCQQRFETGVKIGKQFYQSVMENEVTQRG